MKEKQLTRSIYALDDPETEGPESEEEEEEVKVVGGGGGFFLQTGTFEAKRPDGHGLRDGRRRRMRLSEEIIKRCCPLTSPPHD